MRVKQVLAHHIWYQLFFCQLKSSSIQQIQDFEKTQTYGRLYKSNFGKLKIRIQKQYYIILIKLLMGKKIKKQSQIKLEGNINTEIKQKLQDQNKVKIEHNDTRIDSKSKNQNLEITENQAKKEKKIKHARIIIRNLVVDINQKHIRKLLSPFGQIKEVNIPKHPDKNISKGFAFVEMGNKNSCLKAIKKLNGTSYKGRTIVLDIAVSKQNFMTDKLNEEKKNLLNQDLKKQNSQKKIKNGEQEQQQISNQHNQIDQQINQNKDKIQDDNEDQNMDEERNEKIEDEQQNDQDQRLKKQQQDHQTEMFIRNLPVSTTEDDLFKHFNKQGKIKFVKICKNKETNLSKGTAFIKFYDPQVPKKLIQYSRTYEMFLLKKLKNFVPDPTIKLQIDGMIMKIFPVQGRKQIQQKLKQRQGDDKTTPKKAKPLKKIKKLQDLVKLDIHGKRRLSLALIGRWKAEQEMNKYDYEMFKNHQKQKVEKLKNPNESVSTTRIILKHIDKAITQDQIRSLCFDFLEQKNMNKNNLTYCKLMLEKDMKKSAGFAFIEFKKHQLAKQFIEKLTQSPKILQNRLFIIQFAIQDSRKIMKLNQRNKKDQTVKPHNSKQNRLQKGGNREKRRHNQPKKRKFIKK